VSAASAFAWSAAAARSPAAVAARHAPCSARYRFGSFASVRRYSASASAGRPSSSSRSPSSSRAGGERARRHGVLLGRVLALGGLAHGRERGLAAPVGERQPRLRAEPLDCHLLGPERLAAPGEAPLDRRQRVDRLAPRRPPPRRAAPSAAGEVGHRLGVRVRARGRRERRRLAHARRSSA
jgi:hypothetical protein